MPLQEIPNNNSVPPTAVTYPVTVAPGQHFYYPQQNGQYMPPVAPQTGAYQPQMYQGPPTQPMPQTAGGELIAAQYLISLLFKLFSLFL